jgi:hypothetical protein
VTDLATALAANPGRLDSYKGRDVLRTTIAIRNAGDGLSEAMSIDPTELEIGDTVYVVLECEVDKHTHAPIKEAPDCLTLKQVLKAGSATLVNAELVADVIERQRAAIQRAKDDANGQGRLDNALLERQHEAGEHRELVVGCPLCDDELDAEEVPPDA